MRCMANKMFDRNVLISVASIGLGVLCFAMNQIAAAGAMLDEIVVTAQKREQNIQDVGASITAFSGDQIAELGFASVGDVTAQAPNVNFSTPSGAGSNPSLSIRGVGLSDFSDSNEGPVAMYIDEIYIGSLAGQTANIFDMNRVEILRGPQGTLYGRNTTGGLVHFVSNKPTPELDGHASFTYGSFGKIQFEGAIGGPLTERIRGRVAVFHDENDGTQRDLGTGQRGNVVNVTSFRGRLDFDLSDDVLLELSAHGSKIDNKAQLYKHRGLLDAQGNPCANSDVEARKCFDAFGFRDPNSDPFEVLTGGTGQTPLKIDTKGAWAKLTWGRDAWKFVSITGYESANKRHQDISFPGFIGSDPPLPIGLLLEPIFFTDNSQVTQEFRFSTSTDRFSWLTGLYYFDDRKNGGQLINGDSRLPPGAPPATYSINFDQDTKAWAFFGHGEWKISDKLKMPMGIRYSAEKKDLVDSVDPGTVFGGPAFAFKDKIDTNNVSWNIGLDWQAQENFLLFGNVARGFKSGGWNSGGLVTSPVELTPFDDEILTTYEIGIKSSFVDNRVRLNATVFYNDYKKFQAFTQSENAGLPISRLQNAGNAKIKGGELELTLTPTRYVEAQLGFGYLDTKTYDFLAFDRLNAQGNPIYTDLSGTKMTLSPSFTANGLVRVHYPLFNGEISGMVWVNYSDSYFFDSNNDPLSSSGSFTDWNARIGWRGGPKDRYEVAAYVNNLTNEAHIVEGFNIAGAQSLMYNQRRMAGMALSIFF